MLLLSSELPEVWGCLSGHILWKLDVPWVEERETRCWMGYYCFWHCPSAIFKAGKWPLLWSLQTDSNPNLKAKVCFTSAYHHVACYLMRDSDLHPSTLQESAKNPFCFLSSAFQEDLPLGECWGPAFPVASSTKIPHLNTVWALLSHCHFQGLSLLEMAKRIGRIPRWLLF